MNNTDTIPLSIEDELFKRREAGIPHTSYAGEKRRHKIIQEGRIDLMEQELLTEPDGSIGILAKNELRHWKNMVIISIAFFSRYAIEGGLDEETAFAMSDIYIRKAEDIRMEKECYELYKKGFFDFTTAVYNKKRASIHYSHYVKNTIHYIQIHLHEQITLKQLADSLGISRYNICRIFKIETGFLISEYIKQKRIDSAIHLLVNTDMTIAAISEYLHFSSQSHFISVFKKVCEITPGMYRKLYHK